MGSLVQTNKPFHPTKELPQPCGRIDFQAVDVNIERPVADARQDHVEERRSDMAETNLIQRTSHRRRSSDVEDKRSF